MKEEITLTKVGTMTHNGYTINVYESEEYVSRRKRAILPTHKHKIYMVDMFDPVTGEKIENTATGASSHRSGFGSIKNALEYIKGSIDHYHSSGFSVPSV